VLPNLRVPYVPIQIEYGVGSFSAVSLALPGVPLRSPFWLESPRNWHGGLGLNRPSMGIVKT
jgi:hypothetical protein